ncbi:Nramp family divalent metal transporter [Symmachiella dynata]|uniref:Nramp family divalent metal transporter n=1 Tax=Symmachiella dynata TaxID=2527995 RepID=UPI0030EDB221
MNQPAPKKHWLKLIGPGILVAATGVGAGDLATGAFTGSHLGVAILWAVIVGALLKYILNEGLARWQLATETTLLEGCVANFGRTVQAVFIVYLAIWSFLVGAALMSATGVTANAIWPLFAETDTATDGLTAAAKGKIVYGILHSLVGVILIRLGGYRLFEKVMSVCIAVMFVTVLVTATLLTTEWWAVGRGLVWPTIPHLYDGGLSWTIALMGGVGGTVTVLCYGYWIREEDRRGIEYLKTCRIDLAVGYTMTALFGIGMVIIGSTIEVTGGGAGLIVTLADQLQGRLGTVGRWAFLIGAWGAVTSSLLGVWQSIPYLFADYAGMMHEKYGERERQPVETTARVYQWALVLIATIPMIGLWYGFKEMQKFYAIVGAAFLPMLAVVLLVLNGSTRLIGKEHRNRPLTTGLLWLILLFFTASGGWAIYVAFTK